MGAYRMGVLLAELVQFTKSTVVAPAQIFQKCMQRGANLKTLASVCLLGLLTACSSDPQITPTSRIAVQPETISFDIDEITDEDGNCIFVPGFFQDVPINLSVVNASNQVIGDSRISVYLDFAGNSFSGLEVLQLFSDSNGNGVIDPTDELITGIGDDAVTIRTSRFGGNALLLLRVSLSCSFSGSLYAFTGPVAGIGQIMVNSRSE